MLQQYCAALPEIRAAGQLSRLKIKGKNPACLLLCLCTGGGEAMSKIEALIPIETIERRILFIRGQKVMLSSDLAELYDVEPKVLLQAVKRNAERFPSDFMFQLTKQELASLKSQIVTSNGVTPENMREYLQPIARGSRAQAPRAKPCAACAGAHPRCCGSRYVTRRENVGGFNCIIAS